MNKIKKIFASFSVFFTSTVSKVLAAIPETKYGVFEPTMGEKISKIGKIALPLVLFIIGLFVILSKKITNKVKIITISTFKVKIIIILTLLTIGIIGWVVLNYIASNY